MSRGATTRRALRRTVTAGTWAYAGMLAVLLPLLEWQGERHWLLAFCLYLPGTVWLVPLVPLVLVAAWSRPRLCLVHVGVAAAVLFLYMDFEWSRPPAPRGPTLTVVTNNIGESHRQSLTPFLEVEKPDILALQEATRHGLQLARALPGYHVAAAGEFVVASRFPIVGSGLVPVEAPHYGPVAAWFELDCDGRTLVVYDVHMPTPRQELTEVAGKGVIDLADPQPPLRARRRDGSLEDAWRARLGVAARLVAVFQQETRPFLAVGDFNAPSHGRVYHLFAAAMTDAFAAAGRGYGFTLPGVTANPLSFRGPWMRIDYVFAGRGLRPVACRTEPDRKSQHRAVAARLEWVEEPAAGRAAVGPRMPGGRLAGLSRQLPYVEGRPGPS